MSTEPSIKKLVLEYLRGRDWVYGGQLEDYIRSLIGAKASNASRRCRELENAGKIEKREVQINGKGPHVVQYRKVPEPKAIWIGEEKVLQHTLI